MDPTRDIEELSSSLKMCKPFSVSDVNPSKSSIAHDLSSSEILPCTLNSISLVEISEERDDEENDQVRLDDTVEMKFNDNAHLSSLKRSARVTKSNQKNTLKKAGKGGRKQVAIDERLDSILWSVKRKPRSDECRPARSSVWGSVKIFKYFETSASKVIKKRSKKPKRARGARGTRKEKNNEVVTGLEVSNGNTNAAFGRIRFKVKLGKEMGQTLLKDMTSVAENGPQIVEAIGTETRKLPNFSGHNSNKEVLGASGTQCCNEDLEKVVMPSKSLDICPNKVLENSVTGEKSDGFVADNHQVISCPVDIEESGVAVDNKCLDLGTSPDSEVINLIPEAQINGNEQEDFHDVHISSQTCVLPADISSLKVPLRSRKKGKKRNSNPSALDLNVQDGLDRPGLLDKASVTERCGQAEKPGDGLDFSGASILINTVNLSSNTSSSDGSPGELLLSSKASDKGNIFPYTKKSKGRKHLRNSTPKQGCKIGSEVFESSRNQTENAAMSVGKKSVKNKAACGEFARTIKDYHDTGYNSMDVFEIVKEGDGNMAQEKLDVGVAHIDVPDQSILPRNAWVCCDECFKWRRIEAILADSINETNSRWTCKENVDKDFADCSISQEKSNSEINAELNISDEEDVCHGGYNPKQSHPNPVGGDAQSSWRLIKSNMFMNRSRKSQTIDEIMVCHCKPPTNGKLGCGDGCLNRMLNIECVKGTCPCGERCSNQQFQKRKYAKLKWFRCGKKGYGLQLLEDISEGQFLIEYVGEVLDMQAYEARQRDYASKGHKHFYFMTLNGGEVIDACAKGNLGRFINHSCDPNCRTEKWMVNGEVCVGLFALKDLNKGEEVTFDYNYERVFGAAAKKCVCGSSQCRGYLGGDPRNSDIIVQGDSDDEFPEPVMVYDNGQVEDSMKNLVSTTGRLDDAKASIDNSEQVLISEDKLERVATVVEHLEGTDELQLGDGLANDDDKTEESANDAHHLEEICRNSGNEKLPISFKVMEKSAETLQHAIQKLKSPSQHDIDSLSTISNPRQAIISSSEASALTVVKKKSVTNSRDTKKKHTSDKLGDTSALKLNKVMKTSRLSTSVKKGKTSNSYSVNLSKPEKIVNKSHGLSDKLKKVNEGSATVEGTLNELLDDEGGISKRQDATKGYLKLLLLTAASGDSGSGEAIQSNRELSMILGAILKTQSRSVLVDVINKNGLQMLHNMLKRCRKDFSRIPILRKLLRVLEFLATKEILTKDLINKDPSCEGVESFRESILSLAEHDDKQVHQIARNFRDKWIPWSLRRRLPSHSHWQESQTRDPVKDNNQALHLTVPVSVDTLANHVETRANGKRKSRWDQSAESNKEPKVDPGFNHMNAIGDEEHLETGADEGADMDEDVPPGFTPPRNPPFRVNEGSDFPCKVEIGHPQGKFMNRLPVSYGIPMPIVHQLGYPETDSLEDWCIAPGIPFQPYPPIPTYSRNRSNLRDHRGNYQPAMSRSGHNPPSTSSSVLRGGGIQGTNNRCNFQRGRGSHGAGRHFRQQKWNNSGLPPPPWKRQRNDLGFMGNDPRTRMCGGRNGPQGWNNMEIDSHYFTQNPQQGNYY